METLITILIVIIFLASFSCTDKRANTSKFLFECNEQAESIISSLQEIKKLSIQLFTSQSFQNQVGGLKSYSFGLNSDNDIDLCNRKLGSWEEFEKSKNDIFKLKILDALSDTEKERLFDLLKFLNQNFISGIYFISGELYPSFGYYETPFGGSDYDRFNKRIVLEYDFYLLQLKEQRALLDGNLITDKCKGMLLIMYNKERYLAWVYGGYEKIPEKWRLPTDEIFIK